MESQIDNRFNSRETQREARYAPKTPGDKGVKLLDDTQRMAKATSRKRPGQLLPEGGDKRDITIKCQQT